MNIAYFGSPSVSATLLTHLLARAQFDIPLIITRPDKPSGKRLAQTPTAVKSLAIKKNIEIYDNTSSDALGDTLIKYAIDLCVVFAYGRIIPQSLLSIPQYGFWNIHPSLLPLYRGPSPLIYPLIRGDTQTGSTLMRMDSTMDTGDIILQYRIPLKEHDTREMLEKKLIPLSARLIFQAANILMAGKKLTFTPQNNENATYTRLLKKSDGYISPLLIKYAFKGDRAPSKLIPPLLQAYEKKYQSNKDGKQISAARIIYNLYRGLSPWPGLWTKIPKGNNELRLKLIDLNVIENKLILHRVQVEGKQPIDYGTFIKAYNIY